jgi:N-methylhydantoinase B
MTRTFDAVSLGILWDRLISTADEIVSTLVRTSFSTIVAESYDLTVALFDRNAQMLAQGTYSVPVFVGTSPVTLRHMLAKFPPETLRPGDVIATNDPWLGTGHMFDISVMRPVFRGAELVGYAMSVTHLPDIGGAGFGAAATEIYHEGLRLPICKLVREGRLNDLIVGLVRANVRVPEQTLGDLMANVTCTEVGARALVEFMDEYGLDDLAPLSDAIRDQSERAMRDKLRAIKPGVYENRILIEAIDEPIPLAVRVEAKGEEIAIDFAGTGGCVHRGINVPFCYTNAMALYAVKCLTTPNLPNNEGATRPVKVSAPAGCLLNAQPPFPTGGRHVIGHFVPGLIFGALAEAAPDRVQSDNGMMDLMTVQGRRRDGRGVSTIYFASGGFGALQGRDGADCRPGPSNMAVVPTEIWEVNTNLTVLSRRMLPDSGGPGASRGGVGQEVALRNDSGHPMTIFCMANRTEFPAVGLLGGRPGAKREHRVNDERVHPKGAYVLEPGDRVTLVQAGGGGFGDPRGRPAEAVAADVAEGFVTVDGALRDYGVAIDPVTRRAKRSAA